MEQEETGRPPGEIVQSGIDPAVPEVPAEASPAPDLVEPLENFADFANCQTLLVNKLIKKIGVLRTENILLEQRISDSDKQNKVLQLQIDIMMKKMELLEHFMSQVQNMDEDGNALEKVEKELCKKCKKSLKQRKAIPDYSSSDSELDEIVLWEGSSDDGESYLQNPLRIDVVVATIMKFLSIKTLLTCRLVNSLWFKEATFVLKHRKTFVIDRNNVDKLGTIFNLSGKDEDDVGHFLCHRVKFDLNFLVKSYREVIESFLGKFGREIYSCSIHCEQENSSLLYTEEFRNIFLPFLRNVKHLEISVPTKITERQTIYDDIRPKKFVFERLTSLKLRQMDVSLDIGGYSVAIVKEILEFGPYLRSLTIETHTKEVVTRILQALNEKDVRNYVNQLTELHLDAFLTEEHLMLLLPLEFKLTSLQLSYFTVNVSSAMIEALLCKQRGTLRTLILGDYQKRTTTNSLPLIIKLPVLKELRHLKFVDPLFPDQRQILLNPLNYPEQLPGLSELSFEHENGKPVGPHYFQDMFVCSPMTCQSLKTLKISHGLQEPPLVASAAKMFPNLERLELANASDPVIQMVWKEFTWIKSLSLVLNPNNLNIDSLLTGIPDQVCRRIQEKNLFSQVDLMNALEIIRTEASICGLEDLESLKIDGFTSSLMTAVTGYLALAHMKNLTNVSIKGDIITLSRECRRVLGEKLHLSLFEMF